MSDLIFDIVRFLEVPEEKWRKQGWSQRRIVMGSDVWEEGDMPGKWNSPTVCLERQRKTINAISVTSNLCRPIGDHIFPQHSPKVFLPIHPCHIVSSENHALSSREYSYSSRLNEVSVGAKKSH